MSLEITRFTRTLASAVTSSTEIDIGKAYSKVLLEIPTMPSGCDVFVQGARESGGTFRRIYNAGVNADSTPQAVFFDSTITNCFVEIPAYTRFLKIELSASAMADNQATFSLVCVD